MHLEGSTTALFSSGHRGGIICDDGLLLRERPLLAGGFVLGGNRRIHFRRILKDRFPLEPLEPERLGRTCYGAYAASHAAVLINLNLVVSVTQ
jgi:hypothetical protein